MTTLPLPPFLTLVLGILLATALVYGALSLMRRDPEAPMWEGFGTGWVAIIVILGLIWLGLFGLTLAAVFSGTWKAIEDPTVTTLGLGGLTAALLGAPFLIWGTVLKHQTVRWQKEGHMTDRISKAVEQLGAEKTVKSQDAEGKTVERTVPNLEVRIGAILSLERIAQDSTTHDKGRDHVRVMEILCAYVRNNAPASDAASSLRQEHERVTVGTGPNDPPLTAEQFMEKHNIPLSEDIDDYISVGASKHWASKLKPPREDIALALRVIGRRSIEQIEYERTAKFTDGCYCLDLAGSNLQGADLSGLNFANANFRGAFLDGARLNKIDLNGANLLETSAVGVGAKAANFEHANLGIDLTGSILDEARFLFTEDDRPLSSFNGRHAKFTSAQLIDAQFKFRGSPQKIRNWAIGADFTDALMRGCVLDGLNSLHEHNWPDRFHWGEKGETGLAFRDCQLTANVVSRCALALCFGDGGVELPLDTERPEHWPSARLGDAEFCAQVAEWRSDPVGYRPPQPPLHHPHNPWDTPTKPLTPQPNPL